MSREGEDIEPLGTWLWEQKESLEKVGSTCQNMPDCPDALVSSEHGDMFVG